MKKLDLKIIIYIAAVVIGAIVAIVAICTSGKEEIEPTTVAPSTTTTEATTETTTEATTESTTENTTKNKTTTTKKATTTKANSSSTSSKGYKIETKDGITYVDGVLIANKTYSLPSSYAPGLTKECKAAFNEMAAAALDEEGLTLAICSGYRSYSRQNELYTNYCNRDGKAAADRYSARPGHSEHQTGLAIDVNRASSKFTGTPEQIWLAANCYKYGFIVRYPEGKESITGYKYESWHVRYLGKDLAKKVYDSGLCLEEYYGITSEYA